ncbi:MAG TPA: tRNA (adenosine(37)-N6)-dimethylallyltransferase MiaA [Sphingopyxis sp.]|nr:tRNA (adenosine(37)-N6)-dimethylallyltransferase MiaA [Sphingopyxis sp.]
MAYSPLNSARRPILALIAGPTASGKSACAIALANLLDQALVVNADASQVYSDLSILSARPSREEMGDVPHRLFGTIDGAQPYNAAHWAEDAKRILARAWEDEQTPILVGGTGLYINTLLHGIAPVPDIDPDIRAEVRAMDPADAYALLEKLDPQSAARLHPADRTRIARALEVVRSTGRTIGDWQQQREGGIGDQIDTAPLILLPPRDWLRDRCDLRLDRMFSEGGIEEVARLRERQLSPDLPVMRAIGVPQVMAYLNGQISRDEALTQAKAATRQYAKRQYTWFRHQPPPDWLRDERPLNAKTIGELVIILQEYLLTR